MTNQQSEENADGNILGLSTTELAGLTVDELVENRTAINMLMHYYKQLVSSNQSLKNENNTFKTYVDAYERKKTHSNVSTLLLTTSNVVIAFGVNLLTMSNSNNWPGVVMLGVGVFIAAVGLWFYFKG
jgi:hypothetical protein